MTNSIHRAVLAVTKGECPDAIIFLWAPTNGEPERRITYTYTGFMAVLGLIAVGIPANGLFGDDIPASTELSKNEAVRKAQLFDGLIQQAIFSAAHDSECQPPNNNNNNGDSP